MPEIPSHFTGPGLIDLQVNGYAGFDFNSDPENWTPEHFHQIAEALKKRGIVAVFPTLITDDINAMIARAGKYASILKSSEELESMFPGLHIEGPFISSDDGPRGAHPKKHCKTPKALPGFLTDIRTASDNRISMITVAPELEGAAELIQKATGMGICVGLGHTGADSDEIDKAVRAGAKLSTHLGNGSHQLLPRHENYIQYQLAREELFASFIADGHHVPFYALKNFIRAKGSGRSVLVTDAMSAAEKGAGNYTFGHDEVVVRDDLHVSKPGEPNLAGSALTLDRAILNIVANCSVSFETVWKMASVQPAALVGLSNLPEITVEIAEKGFRLVNSNT